NGRKVWRRQRSLWGQAAANDASPDGRESCDAGFMGQWQDEESGLWYNLHRYMDSRTGQYLSQDPLKLGGGLNTQSYVHNPVGWCDPWGLTDVNATGINGNGYDIYRIYDTNSGKDIYVGLTEDFDRRQAEHLDSGRLKSGMKMEVIDHAETYGEARGVEQYNIDKRETLNLNARGQYDADGKISAGAEGNRAVSYDRTRTDDRANAFEEGYKSRSGKCGS
ncbi:RHS repeat-associated core domain-containing protein, partial [Salmonella enterica subsp. enterica]